jgi:hypothetical protein
MVKAYDRLKKSFKKAGINIEGPDVNIEVWIRPKDISRPDLKGQGGGKAQGSMRCCIRNIILWKPKTV